MSTPTRSNQSRNNPTGNINNQNSGGSSENGLSYNRRKFKLKKQESIVKGNTKEMISHVFKIFHECQDETQLKQMIEMLPKFISKHLKILDNMVLAYLRMEELVIKRKYIRDTENREIRTETIKYIANESMERHRVTKDDLLKIVTIICR